MNDSQIVSTINNNLNKKQYSKARDEAYELENELENIEKQYNKQILNIIKKAQHTFQKNYGSKIQALEDLQEYIDTEQIKGRRKLKKQLQNLYLQTGGEYNEEEFNNFQSIADKLLENYKDEYYPQDNYQKKKNNEAMKLKQMVLKPLQSIMFPNYNDNN